jgi:dihydrofolate reductase
MSTMSAFVYYTATSVNGYIADENSSLQWLFDVGDDGAEEAAAFIAGVGVQVMGSSTYEWLLTNEHLLATPEKWQQVFGDISTRVFTTRDLPRPTTAAFEFRRGAVSEHEAELRALAGDRDVWVMGGGDLAGQFFDAGLLDRIQLTVAPVFLTGGAPLLPRFVPAASLRLVDARPQGQFVSITYDVVR